MLLLLFSLSELFEFVKAHNFGVEVDEFFDCAEKLAVTHILAHAADVVLVLKDAACIVGECLVVHVCHAILGKLLESERFCKLEHVVVGHLDIKLLRDFATEKLPTDRGCHFIEFLVNVFGSESFVACNKPFLEEGNGKLKVAEAVHELFLHIAVEKVVAVGQKL